MQHVHPLIPLKRSPFNARETVRASTGTARKLFILCGDQGGRHASASMIGMPIRLRELANCYLESVRIETANAQFRLTQAMETRSVVTDRLARMTVKAYCLAPSKFLSFSALMTFSTYVLIAESTLSGAVVLRVPVQTTSFLIRSFRVASDVYSSYR